MALAEAAGQQALAATMRIGARYLQTKSVATAV
jgi:hypothetical protein